MVGWWWAWCRTVEVADVHLHRVCLAPDVTNLAGKRILNHLQAWVVVVVVVVFEGGKKAHLSVLQRKKQRFVARSS